MEEAAIIIELILAAALSSGAAVTRSTTHAGIDVKLTMESADGKTPVQEGTDVVIRFEVRDAATKTPIRGARPGAWMDSSNREGRPKQCADRVRVFAAGNLLERAEVDLNTFYVLAMNDDASITVVDPLFGYGGTKLLALIPLASPAEDWALTSDDNRLFISMPGAKQVASIDTRGWTVGKSLTLASAPRRLRLQPDEAYAWAVLPDGVAVIRTSDLSLVSTIAVRSAKDIAFSGDSRWALVTTNEGVAVVDVRTLKKVRDVSAAKPVSLDWSALAGAAYVASEDGTITVIGGEKMNVVTRIATEPGLVQLRVAPLGRHALALNAKTKKLLVVDTASNRVIQTGDLPGVPDQLAFTPQLAYVRLADMSDIQMAALSQLGRAGTPVSFADFPGGQNAFRDGVTSSAPGIVPTVGGDAVLIANPADRSIYFYEEGMAAPKGSFNNYNRQARAVMVVDRSLRERAPGVYETVRRIDRAGLYDVAFLFDSPRIVDCFDVSVAADPARPKEVKRHFAIELTDKKPAVRSGTPVSLQFKVSEQGTPARADDGVVLVFAAGIWQSRIPATRAADGTYHVDFTPPQPGSYSVYLRSQSLGFDYTYFGTVRAQ
ncbi:MAG TPA: hypothetical protein VGF69_14165 [Thermoanaerobaculia bacterium]|jgi:hypothetical protein